MKSDIRVIETCMNSETDSADEEGGWQRSKRRTVVTTHGSLHLSESFAFWQSRDPDQSNRSIYTAVKIIGGCFTNAKKSMRG